MPRGRGNGWWEVGRCIKTGNGKNTLNRRQVGIKETKSTINENENEKKNKMNEEELKAWHGRETNWFGNA